MTDPETRIRRKAFVHALLTIAVFGVVIYLLWLVWGGQP